MLQGTGHHRCDFGFPPACFLSLAPQKSGTMPSGRRRWVETFVYVSTGERKHKEEKVKAKKREGGKEKKRKGEKKRKKVFAVYFFLTHVERAVRTHRCHCPESNVQCTSMACGWPSTNTPPDEGGQNYLHVPTQCNPV